MNAHSTPAAAQDRSAVSHEDTRLLAAPRDDRKDPTPLDFATLMRRVEAEVYDIS
jgi:hypothetical protein